MANLIIKDEVFGELLPLIKDEDITDINYNGADVWVDDLNKGRYKVNVELSEGFQNQFATKLSNLMNVSFNKYEPLLEAETDELRVSIIHESVTNTGKSISIRKTPAVKRLNREKIIKSNYCTKELEIFMENAIKAGCNTVISGTPGVGKTEYVKHLTTYIPDNEKVITIEDNLELRYHQINPNKDCVELKVGETFSYVTAIKACLRQLPQWILLSEARSTEVKYLLESLSTGTNCITTIHTDDARKIPDRIRNMMENSGKKEENDIFSFLDIGIQIKKEITPNGIHRHIDQVVFFSRVNGVNKLVMLYEKGNFVADNIPADIMRKFELAGIKNPFMRSDVTLEDVKTGHNHQPMNKIEKDKRTCSIDSPPHSTKNAFYKDRNKLSNNEKHYSKQNNNNNTADNNKALNNTTANETVVKDNKTDVLRVDNPVNNKDISEFLEPIT